MRAVVWLLLAARPLTAQFSNLATDDTGDRVWFSSWLRLSGSQEMNTPKIFVADANGGVQLVAQAATDQPRSYASLSNPEVSGDGNTLAYLAAWYCPPPLGCFVPSEYSMATVNAYTLPGRFHLSRNGRYVAREGYDFSRETLTGRAAGPEAQRRPPKRRGPTAQIQIIDLTTKQARSIAVDQNWLHLSGGRQVTSSGSALEVSDALWLFGVDGSARLVPTPNFFPLTYPSSTPFAQAAIDDAGDRIVYQATQPSCALISTAASSTATPTTLVGSNLPCTMESLSADGSAVLFFSAADFDGTNSDGLPQCWIVDTISKAVTAVGHDPAGIAEATMSGDGRIVWAATLAGRLIRIERAAGTAKEIVPQTTMLDVPRLTPSAAPGSLVRLTGRGLAEQYAAAAAPLPTTLAGAQVLADGQPLPLLSVSPTEIVFQVPWETQGVGTLTVNRPPSPFEGLLWSSLQIWPSFPVAWTLSDGTPAVLHQDLHGPVTANDPAHPDEIVHLYVTGLGPVTPPVATGAASPSSPLSVMANPVHVRWWSGILPVGGPKAIATVLFAGMAPGTVGLEQIDVQVPHVAAGQLSLSIEPRISNEIVGFPVR
jgi:uncharacterized protein (TIGR03437 family)